MYIFKNNYNGDNFFSSQSEYTAKYLNELTREYNEIKQCEIPALREEDFNEFYKSGNRIKYENVYFKRRTMLRDFALILCIKGNEAAGPLKRIIKAICAEKTWALPAHVPKEAEDKRRVIDLFAAETAQSLTEILSLAGDKLDAETTRLVTEQVKDRVLMPYINRQKPYAWEKMGNNWCAVCGGSVGMTAIYLTEDKEELRKILLPLKETFESYMKSFTLDGACLEGLYYWGYGMTYLTAFLDLYKQRFNEDFPVGYDMLEKMADFPTKCIMGRGVTVSFSDSSENDRVYFGLVSHLKRNYKSKGVPTEYGASFSGDECGRWCRAIRDIWWYEESDQAFESPINILPKAQWAVMKNENLALSFKGGNNGEPHNHNDIGSFTVVKNGVVMLCDLGAGEYTRDYFSANRYTVFNNRSMGHSVPIIDGREQETGKEYKARNFSLQNNTVGADISNAYDIDNLSSLRRCLSLDSEKITLCDSIDVTDKTEIKERFITRQKVFVKNEREVLIEGEGERLTIIVSAGKINLREYVCREHDGSEMTVRAVDVTFEASSKIKFSANFS